MAVCVKLSVLLRKYIPGYNEDAGIMVNHKAGMTIEDVIIELGIPLEKVIMVLTNQKPAKIRNKIKDGDNVRLAMVFGAG